MKFLKPIFILLFFPWTVHANVLDIQHWHTSHGVPVYFVQTQQTPMLVVDVAFDAGSARDNVFPGIAALTNTLLDEGNQGLNTTQMAEGFENVGAEYQHWITSDMSVLQLKTVTHLPQMDIALDYFTKLFHPDFPFAAFQREKRQQKIDRAHSLESPEAVATEALLATIYPKHPYGKPALGTASSLEKIQLQTVRNWYKRYYVAQNAVITMAGAIDLAAAKKIAEKVAKAMSLGKKAAPLPKAPPLMHAVQKKITYSSTQTILRLGQVGLSYHDPDYFPLMVGNYTLGGGTLVSRLSNEIREKRGLAYGASSYFEPLAANGPFIIALATRTKKAPESLTITQHTLQQFLAHGPSNKELQAAKQFIKGNFPLRFGTNTSIARTLLQIGYYKLPLNYLDTYLDSVQALTTAQIKEVFQCRIRPDAMATIIVGKDSHA